MGDSLKKIEKFKLIIPTVSVGNIPQLTVDLVIENDSNYSLVEDDKIIAADLLKFTYPFAGSSNNKTVKSIEIFENKVNHTYILQQRSPIIKGFEVNFYTLLVEKIRKFLGPLSDVIVLDSLSGSDAYIDLVKSPNVDNLYELIDGQRIAVGELKSNVDTKFFENAKSAIDKEISVLAEKEKLSHKYEDVDFEFTEDLPKASDKIILFAPGSFQSKVFVDSLLLQIVSTFINITSNIIYFNMLSYEGDNSFDAVIFLKSLTTHKLVAPSSNLKFPHTWESVYGFKSDSTVNEYIYN